MAGSGKTTFMQRMNAHFHEAQKKAYIVNLDPAVMTVPYGCNLDIRKTVNYKGVMKQYGLGPNGAIMTALNLYATKFDQVISLMEKRRRTLEFIMVDTPGQIEVFTWSASGQIITEMLASSFPTIIIFVVDTPQSSDPTTFMSNMMYACSIMYKTKLPLLVVFNKIDVTHHQFAKDWMSDFEAFQDALAGQTSYMSGLTNSMSLVLDEFYSTLQSVGVSSITGAGVDELVTAMSKCKLEYFEFYRTELERNIEKRKEEQERKKEREMKKLQKDLEGVKK
eukprot:CAMPEP_0201528836 /NCGR_PEP_ID=MMETSP0161_2-20130828/39733_1 /ASSEMBLY_ACC=CAM_ASM_000251 /TAXON_ID=180227 /ORGANISM="Neoparamoeba aestuarina, Strain SoJaBio B1-5/56/2" /LENGTH=278 /DNA_ID=CAMNT_0047930327 /DNA_START=80 /DNA_END=916 /DNA_ORIENTATION=+